jgi:hypothetical protein
MFCRASKYLPCNESDNDMLIGSRFAAVCGKGKDASPADARTDKSRD